MKKGQGLSLNTVIIAAIVLIVLVVLWAIFTGRMGTFSSTLKETTDPKACPEGSSVQPVEGCDFPIYGNYEVPAGKVCCREAAATS